MAEPIRPLTRAAGVRQALAPVLDSPARPRGRAHETYSNVPYLLSALGLAYVRGLRIDDATTGVAATTKHFVGFSASEGGLNTATTHLGSHKLHDLYAPPFEAAVGGGGLQAVIDSYSPVTVSPSLRHARY